MQIPRCSGPGPHVGIDVSHYQGDILADLQDRTDIAFVIAKATQGSHYSDPEFHITWPGLKDLSILRGAYHFYDTRYSPEDQIQHYARTLGDLEARDIRPVLDIELASLVTPTPADELTRVLLIALGEMERLLGRRPILYTSYEFAQEYLTDPALSAYPLWLAEYSSSEEPRIPDVWQLAGFQIWQRSDRYHVGSETTDLDVLQGSCMDLIR